MAVLTKITSRSLADNAVTSAKIQDGAVIAPDVADGSITAAKLASDAVTTVKIANDAVTAAKIPAGAVVADVGTGGITATQLATNAVTTIKIANDAVDADKLASNAVVTASIVDANITAAKIGTAAVTSAKMGDVIEVKPHIKYGMLYPSLKDAGGTRRLSDGVAALVASTVGPAGSAITSSLYGTVQADGKMYYYTDIKGSKPIKDSRIGSHFGSQRHKFKSVQKLEQETATNGQNIYSIDGRDWVRANLKTVLELQNNASGTYPTLWRNTSAYVEFTGYFSSLNMIVGTAAANHGYTVSLDGATPVAKTNHRTTAPSPLNSRFVDYGSVSNVLSTTLGVHTVRIQNTANNKDVEFFGIELIAQDTTSPTTRNQIQIHPQNVVSSGKRFAVGITQSATATDKKALHYNPFAFKTDGTTAWASGAHNGTGWPAGLNSAHNIDTATSLGLNKWLHSSNYYKPYNGGRVVVWVDSSGNIKTSVTVMPPNARSMNTGNIANKANASVTNTLYYPTFETGAVDDFPTAALAEVAKTYHVREFGNGNANTGAAGSDWKDASMLDTTARDIWYVMDDGLTSIFGDDVKTNGGADATNDFKKRISLDTGTGSMFFTFIGTGISITDATALAFAGTDHYELIIDGVEVEDYTSSDAITSNFIIAQNLPYGTHILKINRVTANSNGFHLGEIAFHQPKMPPIPEDACILADYMLMADFVPQTGGEGHISKGTRRIAGSRDMKYDGPSNTNMAAYHYPAYTNQSGYVYFGNVSGTATQQFPYFGTSFTSQYFTIATYTPLSATYTINGSNLSSYTLTGSGGGFTSATSAGVVTQVAQASKNNVFNAVGGTLGVAELSISEPVASSKYLYSPDLCVASPIHTSSHYQTFETPFLHELVGGDRNMEQNNLVVTGDGKTWDEVTRDTSYLSPNMCVSNITADSGNFTSSAVVVFDEHRGYRPSERRIDCYFKDFAYAYDKFICLVDGQYEFFFNTYTGAATDNFVKINGNAILRAYGTTGNTNVSGRAMGSLERGDYVQVFGGHFADNDDMHTGFFITRLGAR